MKKIKYLILAILPFLAILSVKAESFNHFSVGYSYSQPAHNISGTWVTYSTNNNSKSLQSLPNQEKVYINTFNFRFALNNNGFKEGNNYIVTFDWANYDYSDTMLSYFESMSHVLSCRLNDWNATNQNDSYCFNSFNVSATDTSNSQLIKVTISFTPKRDFFGLTLTNQTSNGNDYPSEGWEVNNASYSVVSSGTQEIIDNQNQNTQNIINNQNQNTQDIIDSLLDLISESADNTQDIIDSNEQSAQDIMDNLNNNFQSCHISYNLVNIPNISLDRNTNRTYTYNTSEELSAGTYTLSYDYFSPNSATIYLSLILLGQNLKKVVSISNNGFVTFTINNSFNRFYFYISNNDVDTSVTLSNLMLVSGSTAKPYEPYGERICTNRLDETTNAINDLNNTINDSSGPSLDSLNNSAGWLPAGPVDSILNLPLALFNNLTVNLNKTCNPVNVTLPFINSNLQLPCLSVIYQEMPALSTC